MTRYEQDALDARLSQAAFTLGSRSSRVPAAERPAIMEQIRAARDYIYQAASVVSVAETFVLAIEARIYGAGSRPGAKPTVKPRVQPSAIVQPAPPLPFVGSAERAPGDWFATLPTAGKLGVAAGAAFALWWLWRRL